MKGLITVILTFSFLQGCIEPFDAETDVFEDVLVIDARISDEVKQHQISLSRARPFEQDSTSAEIGAMVIIRDSDGNTYDFQETEAGTYVSAPNFGVKPNKSYQLDVTTNNGKSYVSEMVLTPEKVNIGQVYFERDMNDVSEEGVRIFIDTESKSSDLKYFRYEYEETYKIIAPSYNPFEFEIIDDIACEDGDGFEVGIKPRIEQQQICYGAKASTAILQASTDALTSNALIRFPIRFINKSDFIISHRYSMLVRQHTQTLESYSYFQDLEAFSSTESVFTDVQAGFLAGNIRSVNDANEKVVGYFQVTSVSEKRIFFNYTDLFPEASLPEYPINCDNFGNPRLIPQFYHCTEGESGVCDGNCTSPLIQAIKGNSVVFFAQVQNNPLLEIIAPYYTQPRACGDCTLLGSNVKPDFWIEE